MKRISADQNLKQQSRILFYLFSSASNKYVGMEYLLKSLFFFFFVTTGRKRVKYFGHRAILGSVTFFTEES